MDLAVRLKWLQAILPVSFASTVCGSTLLNCLNDAKKWSQLDKSLVNVWGGHIPQTLVQAGPQQWRCFWRWHPLMFWGTPLPTTPLSLPSYWGAQQQGRETDWPQAFLTLPQLEQLKGRPIQHTTSHWFKKLIAGCVGLPFSSFNCLETAMLVQANLCLCGPSHVTLPWPLW